MRTISVASLNGGVGKTRFCFNLAANLAGQGKRVCLLDADTGLNSLGNLLNLQKRLSLEQALLDKRPVHESLHPLLPGVDILLGGSGVSHLALMSGSRQHDFLQEWCQLEAYDFLIFDNPPGITPQTISLCLSCRELIFMVAPKCLSTTHCHSFLGILRENGACLPPFLVLNKCRNHDQEAKILELHESTWLYLGLSLLPLGTIPWDARFSEETARQEPLSIIAPDSPASQSLEAIAERLLSRLRQDMYQESHETFWKKTFVQLKHRVMPSGLDRPQAQAGFAPPGMPSSTESEHSEDPGRSACAAQDQAPDPAPPANGTSAPDPMNAVWPEAQGPGAILGLVAPDPSMRQLLQDIVTSHAWLGLIPRDILEHPEDAEAMAGSIICLERDDQRLPKIRALLQSKPAILLSPQRGLDLGSLDKTSVFLPKPFDIDELISCLQTTICPGDRSTETWSREEHRKQCSARA